MQQVIVDELCAAWAEGDAGRLARVLDARCVLTVDSDSALSAWTPTSGASEVAAALISLSAEFPRCEPAVAQVNGMPGIILRRDDHVVGVVVVAVGFRHVRDVWAIVNPEKLRDWNRRG
ncbi:MAG: hypothetical protein LBU78_10240 [Microbacterium sp.]|nr:hypothetical protein [Microbacterium sp.]